MGNGADAMLAMHIGHMKLDGHDILL